MKWWIWFFILMLIASFFLIKSISAEELPVLDFSEYEVGKYYPENGLITWISEDKGEIEYISVKITEETSFSLLQDIKGLLRNQ